MPSCSLDSSFPQHSKGRTIPAVPILRIVLENVCSSRLHEQDDFDEAGQLGVLGAALRLVGLHQMSSDFQRLSFHKPEEDET